MKLDLSEEPNNEEKSEKALRSEARGAVTRGTATELIPVLYLSDAHVEAMMIQVFGPKSSEQSATLLRAIRMPDIKQDERGSSFANLSVAMVYVRKWREALRWCARQMPRSRTLVKIFLASIHPKPLAKALYDEDFESINDCMTAFITKFSAGVESLQTLTTYDEKPSKAVEKKAPKVEAKKEQAPVGKAPAKAQKGEKSDEWKSTKTCFYCGVYGHVKPNCPSLKAAAQPAPPPKKIGRLSMGSPEEEGPFVAVDVSAVGQPSKGCLRMTGHLDGGAQCDAVGQNWCPT